ncbi:Ctf8p and Ctf18p associating protein [Microbotryomycetes sp. JL221]|nr:Ctf8p and Ctf18p associating protein [Microbotryomycetes sp. JL221]
MTVPKHARQVVFSSLDRTLLEEPVPTYSLLALPSSVASLLLNEAARRQALNDDSDDEDEACSDSLQTQQTLLEIRGDASDAAVLVTRDSTFNLRGVQNSNSLCLCSTPQNLKAPDWFHTQSVNHVNIAVTDDETTANRASTNSIEIETVLHETLELVKSVPKLDKLDVLLKATDYTGEDAEMSPKRKQICITMDTLRARVPASDVEIERALTNKRIVNVNGRFRKIPTTYLAIMLPALLNALPASVESIDDPQDVNESMNVDSHKTPVKPRTKFGNSKTSTTSATSVDNSKQIRIQVDQDELELALDAVDCSEQVAKQVISWYTVDQSLNRNVTIQVNDVVRDVGFSTLEQEGFTAQRLDAFMERWKTNTKPFESLCDLSLLAGYHVVNSCHPPTITYLPPTRLSSDPSTRFQELFSIKQRWKDTDMILFLKDLTTGDKKKLDGLILKFVRKVKATDKEGGGTVWTARNLW